MDESIEVAPSEDNGNVPVETPSEQPETVTTTEPTVEQPSEQLYDLPDGRKVPANVVLEEYKNILPDYTRKSQALADIEKAKNLPTNNAENPYTSPDYVPQTYAELIEVATKQAIEQIDQREKSKVEQQQAIENEVSTQLSEVRKIDPSVDENSLFEHANKYGFTDLKLAHQNMKDMSETIKKVQTTTAQNIAKRNDPVSAPTGTSSQRLDPSQFGNAVEYLRALKASKG